jgi:malonyl CoA-acyl carrier protein transacylase
MLIFHNYRKQTIQVELVEVNYRIKKHQQTNKSNDFISQIINKVDWFDEVLDVFHLWKLMSNSITKLPF